MTILQALIFALIQGISELFPVSSVAHGVLTPYILGWNLDPVFLKEHFLPFVVMLHLGTAAALLVFFREEWLSILGSLAKQGGRRKLMLIVYGTLPAAALGFLFEKNLRHIFSNVSSAACFLIANALLLYWGEKIKSKGKKSLEELNPGQALVIGLFQSLALVPGFSRSGASITAGFWMGLSHEAAAKFSMMLATPIICGAAVLEIPKMVMADVGPLLYTSILGGLAAGVAAFISVWALMHWFKRHEFNAMRPFAVYCALLGISVLALRSY